jgi:hypothetical protein
MHSLEMLCIIGISDCLLNMIISLVINLEIWEGVGFPEKGHILVKFCLSNNERKGTSPPPPHIRNSSEKGNVFS